MATHIMLDLETFGTGRKAMIISIGAVKFDADEIIERFHVGITPESAEAAGLKLSASTLLWWMGDERREAWAAWKELEKVSITEALVGFSQWCAEVHKDDPPPYPIWGNGSTFDNVILRDACELCGFDYPAPFYMDYCYRTVKKLAPDIVLERVGVHHSAVDDAESQARHLQAIAKKLGVQL
jgi:hypothetical protein